MRTAVARSVLGRGPVRPGSVACASRSSGPGLRLTQPGAMGSIARTHGCVFRAGSHLCRGEESSAQRGPRCVRVDRRPVAPGACASLFADRIAEPETPSNGSHATRRGQRPVARRPTAAQLASRMHGVAQDDRVTEAAICSTGSDCAEVEWRILRVIPKYLESRYLISFS